MTGRIMWECECGNDNFIVAEDLLETGCVNEIETECSICGECVTLDVRVRVLPRAEIMEIKRIKNDKRTM